MRTKRDIYYQSPTLFGKQDTVDSLVNSLARLFNVSRTHLCIVAKSKGLVTGPVVFRTTQEANSAVGKMLPVPVHGLDSDTVQVSFLQIFFVLLLILGGCLLIQGVFRKRLRKNPLHISGNF